MAFSCREVIDDPRPHPARGSMDGPAALEQSLALGRYYARLGIARVICTSHFIPGTAWAASREIVLEKMAAVQDCFDSNAVDVTLLPGMEIAFHRKLVERLEHGQLLPLAGSSRFLVEPSFNDVSTNCWIRSRSSPAGATASSSPIPSGSRRSRRWPRPWPGSC